jgi:succinate dehydrogenase / fumarate reductase cytochrome b subunit
MPPKKRPIHLNLLQIRFPAPAIVSILHRASGVILFLCLPLFLWLLSSSLRSQASFDNIHTSLTHPVSAFITWVMLSALLYHLIAGVRHLLMDAGIGESLQGGRFTAYLVQCISAIGIILLGVWLW